jgi:hypothetical protein
MPSAQPRSTGFSILRAAVACALLGAAMIASAQSASTRPIEQQMSAAERAATGIDTLSPAQLAALNAWLDRTLDVETAKAAEAAKADVIKENRGLMLFGSGEPIVGRIADEFRGFGQNRQYTLDNGQVWRQIDTATLSGVRKDSPAVSIKPSVIGNAWYLSIEGYNTRAKVQRVK